MTHDSRLGTSVRSRFPALSATRNGRPVLFFDNPAGTQVPTETIEGYRTYLETHNANTGGFFETSRATDCIIDQARAAMADFLGASDPAEIIFGQNMTSLAFALSRALSRMLQPGDEIAVTRLEHDANIAPWLALQDAGITVRWIDFHPEDVTLDLEDAERVIGRRTRLVAVGYASNAFGTVNDVRRIASLAHAVDAWVFVDAVHFGPHGPIDVQAIGADLLACSPYKFFGPHLGVLWGRYEVLSTLRADHVRPSGDVPPGSWETGTLSHEALAALLGTVRYLESLAPDQPAGGRRAALQAALTGIRRYERGLSRHLIAGMQSIRGLRLFGITEPARFEWRVPTVSFLLDGRQPDEVARLLGEQGIHSWSGNHYALEPMGRLGLDGTQRIGLVHYNTTDEIDRFLETLEAIAHRPSPAD
jgi:cysteine desulfurase family protein (TIGR01976 family)